MQLGPVTLSVSTKAHKKYNLPAEKVKRGQWDHIFTINGPTPDPQPGPFQGWPSIKVVAHPITPGTINDHARSRTRKQGRVWSTLCPLLQPKQRPGCYQQLHCCDPKQKPQALRQVLKCCATASLPVSRASCITAPA